MTATKFQMAKASHRRPVRVPEKAEQQHIVQLLRSIGAKVYVSGTVRRRGDFAGTMQTPGIPDVEAFLPPRGSCGLWRLLKVEVKRVGGQMRPEQAEYRDLCARANVVHIVGPLDAVIAWLASEGYVTASQFPHYRQPREDNRG